jgi:hypothetical protein
MASSQKSFQPYTSLKAPLPVAWQQRSHKNTDRPLTSVTSARRRERGSLQRSQHNSLTGGLTLLEIPDRVVITNSLLS